MTKISVVIPVFNVEDYLDECFESLLNQTYPIHEIIAINDGSTDKSGEILDNWAKKYNFIKVIHQENSGAPGGPRNKGISISTGDYINFIDPDDLIDTDYYEKLVKNIEEYQPDILITNIKKFTSKKSWIPHTFVKMRLFNQNKLTTLYDFPALIHNLGPANKLFRRAFLLENNLKFLEGYAYEDVHFTSCSLFLAKRVYINKDTFYYWRRRESTTNLSITQQSFRYKAVEDRIVIHQAIDQFLKEHNLSEFKYIKDVRAVVDFIRHGAKLYGFSDEEQKRFFVEVNSYLDTIDKRALDHLPTLYYDRARYFFIRNKLDFELVASVSSQYGYLPSFTEKKDKMTKVFFDFSYLHKNFNTDSLLPKKVQIPQKLIKGQAVLIRGIVNETRVILYGYSYIDYMNTLTNEQITVEAIFNNRKTKEEMIVPVTLYNSFELSDTIRYDYCKFKVDIETEHLMNLIQNNDVIDIRFSITVDNINKIARLSSTQNTNIENYSNNIKMYITKQDNISLCGKYN
ncbi:glycosyltransferase family 2 protein [Heyndrickxia sporothermodurans]|uniref:Glycosyltransferase 2-like domain-containing protein n=1 Tax=Heyndrickxia sporothermodurans TaxID=46224 RepID=A0A150LBD4_9BACI|nr:glycosyltransferase [Heyndrickxia sporothermodurans]KYD09565.1 hypothetical protein B4102_1963 [Heyndrickxia sporothermodurans]MED3650508.1 glycosyltransferase [Heyndrickxia sporothermodurans]MED3654403.1 glycosyltransferase [Heyndrickxia sporothermodurans]MED3697272.1 glycosyltransferase [Heyndrickxia sporothermodurans]